VGSLAKTGWAGYDGGKTAIFGRVVIFGRLLVMDFPVVWWPAETASAGNVLYAIKLLLRISGVFLRLQACSGGEF
jgi:hypothetical protein